MSTDREKFVLGTYRISMLTDEQATKCEELKCSNLTPKNPNLPHSHCEWVGPGRALMQLVFVSELCRTTPPNNCPKELNDN